MGKSKKQYQRKLASRNNIRMENFYISMLYNLYTSCYEWQGLPDTIDARVIEKGLIGRGSVIFFYEKELNEYIALPADNAAALNQYGIPYRWAAYGQDGYQKIVKNSDCVYCLNLNNRYSDLQAIYMYADRLTNTQRSLDVNVALQKFPGVIRTTPEHQLTIENIEQSYENNEYLVYLDEQFDLKRFEHINFNIPYIADKLEYTSRDILADALNYIGVQYSSSNKRERLASTEVDSNIGFTEACRAMHLLPRKDCCRRLKEKFGWDVNVDINLDFVNMLKIADINPNALKENHHNLYDSSGTDTTRESDLDG